MVILGGQRSEVGRWNHDVLVGLSLAAVASQEAAGEVNDVSTVRT